MKSMKNISLTEGWRFFLGEQENAWQKDFNDDSFTGVTLPHDWSVTLPFSQANSSGTGYVSGGIGWYRCHFCVDGDWDGLSCILSFDGVYKHAKIWFNGYYLGFHANGWTPFSYDVTPFIRRNGEDNVIAVRIDHRDLADCRWFTGSGITRKVSLIGLPEVNVPEHGMFFRTLSASEESADILVETEVCNNSVETFSGVLFHRLAPLDGSAGIIRFSTDFSLLPGASCTVDAEATLEAPKLWSPENPSLYLLSTFIFSEAGLADTGVLVHEEIVGIRAFHFDPDNGFFLNGRSMKLKGVCLHDDCGALGAAATKEIWYRRLVKLKEAGTNAIRMSHNPHMDELYELCDELGFMVMDEAFDEWEAPKNKWSTGHNVYPPKHQGYYEDFPQCHEEDLLAMVLRGRNHPSVILWSIGNEIDYPNDPYCHPLFTSMTGNNDKNKPAAERMYNPDKPNAERLAVLAAMLAGKLRQMDDSHPITLAAAFPELSSQIGFLDNLDVAGYNYKEHLYEESHKRFPDLPFLGSENSHSLEAWKAVRDNDYISGQFLWTGIDYLGEAHGWPVRAAASGFLNLGGFEKFSFYRRQSFWSDKPMAHLACARQSDGPEWRRPFLENWNYAPGEQIEVRCYTNQPVAELFLNGQPLGSKTKSDDEDSIRWIVPFAPGKLQVYAYDSLTDPDCPAAWDTLETVCAPSQLSLAVCDVPEAFWQSENPIRQVEFTVQDCEGEHKLWTLDSKTFTAHKVEVGTTDGIHTVITGGINSGATVVSDISFGAEQDDKQTGGSPFMPGPRNRNKK